MEKRYQMFTVLVSKCARLIKRIKTIEMKEFDLQLPHVSCLYYLYIADGPITAAELCEACDEDKAYISRTIDSLEKEGCVVCATKGEKKYKSPLMLTEKGREISEKIAQKIDNIVDDAGSGVTEKDRKVFYHTFMQICENLEKICNGYGEND